ncbi:MAG: hypothetical protein FWF12_00110 [Betaproteobacteria bacterium]|nr:hypothetical protein [Betaproteobacteria bacterium]
MSDTLADSRIEQIVEEINDRIAVRNLAARRNTGENTDHNSARFMLTESIVLTVKKANKPDYSKKEHTGGEEFMALRCYASKRGGLIYVFRPLQVADYAEMEMTESAAKKSLSGFEAWLKTIVDSSLDRECRDAQNEASIEAERDKLMATRAEEYAHLGFGTW